MQLCLTPLVTGNGCEDLASFCTQWACHQGTVWPKLGPSQDIKTCAWSSTAHHCLCWGPWSGTYIWYRGWHSVLDTSLASVFLKWKAGRCICGYHKPAFFFFICTGEQSKMSSNSCGISSWFHIEWYSLVGFSVHSGSPDVHSSGRMESKPGALQLDNPLIASFTSAWLWSLAIELLIGTRGRLVITSSLKTYSQ